MIIRRGREFNDYQSIKHLSLCLSLSLSFSLSLSLSLSLSFSLSLRNSCKMIHLDSLHHRFNTDTWRCSDVTTSKTMYGCRPNKGRNAILQTDKLARARLGDKKRHTRVSTGINRALIPLSSVPGKPSQRAPVGARPAVQVVHVLQCMYYTCYMPHVTINGAKNMPSERLQTIPFLCWKQTVEV